MRFLHTSDWHLGRMIYGRSLLEDQTYFIDQIFLPAVRESRPDGILLAGDIYDRQIASVEAIRLFNRTVEALAELGIPLLAVSGNHDGADRMVLGAELLRNAGIYVARKIEDVFSPAVLRRGEETAHVYLLPWCYPSEIRDFLGRNDLRGFADSYTALLDKVRETLDPNSLNILVCHCFAAGGQVSSSESPLFIGGGGEVPLSCFRGFDYVALGHLHAPQRSGPVGRYSGSPLKYSFDEEHHQKSMVFITVEKGGMSQELVPILPLRDLRTLSGTMDDFMSGEGTSDYVFLRITDSSPVYLPAEKLRPRYPNLLGLRCDWMDREASGDTSGLREQLRSGAVDSERIFEEFLRQICGQTPTEDDLKFFRSLLDEEKEETP